MVSLAVAQVVIIFIVYHKLSNAIQTTKHEAVRNSNNIISQIEGLLSIHAELNPTRGLPRSRGWVASPDFLSHLISSAQQYNPVTVVECSSGMSTVVLAACMRNAGKGRIYSLEHDEYYAKKTRALLELHKLSDWATVLDAPLVSTRLGDWSGSWYDIKSLPEGLRIDMLVIDGPPDTLGALARYPALPQLYGKLENNAVVYLDDANRESEKQVIKRWLREYSDLESVEGIECEKGCALLIKCNKSE